MPIDNTEEKDVEVPDELKEKQDINEVQMAINDYTSNYNKNKHIVLKSKIIDADKLADIAIEKLKELHKLDSDDEKEKRSYFK